jgi:hypothetical protein
MHTKTNEDKKQWVKISQANRLRRFQYGGWVRRRIDEMSLVQVEAVKAAFEALD